MYWAEAAAQTKDQGLQAIFAYCKRTRREQQLILN
jgi:hypothetical protein